MTDFDKMNFHEQEAIKDLRTRMQKDLPPELYNDSLLFYRFLKARDFDAEKAEVMLRKNLKWRKVFQVDSILETLKPKEVYQNYIAARIIGFDKVGDVIMYAPTGKTDSRDILKCIKMSDLETHHIHFAEESLLLMKKENEKSGRNRYQTTLIIDLDQLTIANATNKASAEMFLGVSHLLQDNYPETLKAAFVINAPSYYVFIYSILKKVLSSASVQKIRVFGRNGWKEALLQLIDANVFPACLGGTRTDADGNPRCLTIMNHCGRLPEKYHLTNDERRFKDRSCVKKTTVSPLSKNTIPVDVKQCGSWIHWEFECKSKDIEFGLFFQDHEHEVELLPMHRFNTSDGTETGSYKTESVGKCLIIKHYNLIIFDNSYSWFTSKEVHYTVKVANPDS